MDEKFDSNGYDGLERCGIDFPRVNFYGVFRANVGTGNNTIENFKLAMENASGTAEKIIVDLGEKKEGLGASWNYPGDMTYNWVNCKITSVYGKDGVKDTKTCKDLEINPSSTQVSGRITDLDPWQQLISRIFGFQVNICEAGNKRNKQESVLVSGNFKPASFRDIWKRSAPTKKGGKGADQIMSSTYTSILTNVQFGGDLSNYEVLSQLKDHSVQNDNTLQISFVLDGYNNNSELETYTYGRVYGFIGCYTNSNPPSSPPSNPIRSFKYGRYLYPKNSLNVSKSYLTPPSWSGNFSTLAQFAMVKPSQLKIGDKNKPILIVNVSNCIPTVSAIPDTIYSNDFDPANVDVGDIIIYQKQDEEKKVEIGRIKSKQYTTMKLWKENCGIFVIDDIDSSINVFDNKYPIIMQFGENDKKINKANEKRQKVLGDQTQLLVSTLHEAEFGIYLQSEDFQQRLGTVGTYDSVNCNKENKFYVYGSLYGKPLNGSIDSKALNGILIKPQVYPIWRQDTTVDSTSVERLHGIFEITKELKFEILNKDNVQNGMIQVSIKAPKSLIHPKTLLLPRQQWYMDSFAWNLIFLVKPKRKGTDENKNENENEILMGSPSSHGIIGTIEKIVDEVKTDLEVERKKDYMYLFMGSALVFEEMTADKLPVIPVWQPSMGTDLTHESWKSFLKSDDYAKKHTPYIHPILRQYANLYPIMSSIVNLDSFRDVTSKISSMIRAFNVPFDSPYYMPVTRDMSGMKLSIIREWLQNPVYCDALIDPLEESGGYYGVIKDVPTLKSYLQAAIELELSTLPPYLSALYSMDPSNDNNQEIIRLLESIVHQEMQHMGLACNLLLSIGGKPQIAYKDVCQRTQFPRKGLVTQRSKDKKDGVAGVLPHLKLQLSPMNVTGKNGKAHGSTTELFMKIEAPCRYILDPSEETQQLFSQVEKHLIHGSKLETSKAVANELEANKNAKDDVLTYNVVFSPINDAKSNDDDDDIKTNYKIETKVWESVKKYLSTIDGGITDMGSKDGIGAFYQLIRKGFKYLTETLGEAQLFASFNKRENCAFGGQIGPSMMNGCNYVYDADSAYQAIEAIISEGEGTSITDIWTDSGDLAHFHKFFEIQVGYPIINVHRYVLPHTKHVVFQYVFNKSEAVKIAYDENGVELSQHAWNWLSYDHVFNKKGKTVKPTTSNDNAKDIRVKTFNTTFGKLLLALQNIVDKTYTIEQQENSSYSEIEKTREREMLKAVGVMRQLQIDYTQCLRPTIMPGFAPNSKNKPTPAFTPIAPNWVPPDDMLYD